MLELEANVAVFKALTVAPSIGLPCESTTFPVMVPEAGTVI